MLGRIWYVLRLDASVYEEVGPDRAATLQAMVIILLAVTLSGVGRALTSENPLLLLINQIPGALVGWVLLASTIYALGSLIQGRPIDYVGILRVIGFAVAPLMLSGIQYVGFLSWVWALICIFLAVRKVYDLDGPRTLLVVAVGIILAFSGWAFLGFLVGLLTMVLG